MNNPKAVSIPVCNVLVVDDSRKWQKHLAKLIRIAVPSVQIHLATTFDEAETALESETAWNLVATDVALSKNDDAGMGISILNSATDRGLPTIVVSVTKIIGARGAASAVKRGARYFNKWDLTELDETKREFVNHVRTVLANEQTPTQTGAVSVFVSYSRKDAKLWEDLEAHFSTLNRQNVISVWNDRQIGPGEEWRSEIDEHLNNASLILLLVSSYFVASDYCYDSEMKRAIQRHESGQARVIPIILRPCDWQDTPFAKLKALPKDSKPVTSWSNIDDAFLDIAEGVRQATKEWKSRQGVR